MCSEKRTKSCKLAVVYERILNNVCMCVCCEWISVFRTEQILLRLPKDIKALHKRSALTKCHRVLKIQLFISQLQAIFCMGEYNISPFNILVYLSMMKECFSLLQYFFYSVPSLCYFVTPFAYYRIELRELLKWVLILPPYIVYYFEFIDTNTHIFSIFPWELLGKYQQKQEG